MATTTVPVVIVGGGPVGLCTSLLLSRFGVPSLLVERHPRTSIHPRARGLNVRTMELLRVWGLEDQVRTAGRALENATDVVWAESLVGPERRRVPAGGRRDNALTVSPTSGCACAQDALEPVLLANARSYGVGSIEFDHELIGFEQFEDGVVATVRDRKADQELVVRAKYLVAADGAESGVRKALGASVFGPGVLNKQIGIYARAELGAQVAERPAALYFIDNARVSGLMAAVNNQDRWVFYTDRPESWDDAAGAMPSAEALELFRQAAGMPDLEVEVLNVLPWAMAAQTAERFCFKRVLLAGDAAHVIPPVGGYGMNTGIQDAHNIAWKLAGVLNRWADPSLLQTYDSERLPVARFVTEQALLNMRQPGRPEQYSTLGLALGASYDSAAVVADGTPASEVSNPVMDYMPMARPGSRAPHVWLEREGQRVSAIDLFDTSFTLLAGSSGQEWCDAAVAAADDFGAPMRTHKVGSTGDLRDPEETWTNLYGVDSNGAVLVRPDGFVAWRSAAGARTARSTLRHVLSAVLGK
jgi:putative polyketide hydroxylase